MIIDPKVKISTVYISDLVVNNSDAPFIELLNCAKQINEDLGSTSIGEIPGVQTARKLFRAINLDPTKHRPSSEALLRRALKNKPFHQINSLVDIANWCSLDFLLPICVYDLDKIQGEIILRLGKEDEFYSAHNNRVIKLHNRYVIADDLGAFGSPITDSVRTAVDLTAKNCLMVIFSPSDYNSDKLSEQSVLFSDRVKKYCGGSTNKIEVISD